MTKLDTSLAFGFYLKNYQDFEGFKCFLEKGKQDFKDNWVFSIFDRKPNFAKYSFKSTQVNTKPTNTS